MFFKKGDLFIYSFLVIFFLFLITHAFEGKKIQPQRIEVYVNNKLNYTYKLEKKLHKAFIPTDIGGVNLEIKDYRVRVTSSFSPRKLCVKQGWIKNPGETIIGIPDKLLIKVVGDSDQFDTILQ